MPSHAFDNEHARLQCFLTNGIDFLLRRRLVPRFGFRDVIKGDDDEALGRSAIERYNIFGADDVLSAGVRGGRSGFRAKLFETFRIDDVTDVNDGIGAWALALGLQSRNRDPAEREAS